MEVDEKQLRHITRRVLNEYLDKDYMIPLKRYMSYDETDQAYECAHYCPWLFMNFIEKNEDIEDAINSLIADGKVPDDIFQWEYWEAAEKLADFFKSELNPWCEDFIQYCSYHGGTEIPLFCVADFSKEIHNDWLVHMTSSNNVYGLYKEGFSYGVDLDQLAYTPARGTTDYKYGAGYNFAFEACDADTAENSHYGDAAVLFQASGVEIYHYGDSQHQVIFYGPSARNLIFLYQERESSTWYVNSEITGNTLVRFDDLQHLVNWCISNFPQYHNHLVGRSNQRRRMERNVEKRKSNSKKVSEGIFSRYSEVVE
jgi:hypothetical protein